ncbi:MAG: ECF-type sigma factor [Phycisphaerales bacterium JB040]
MPHQDEPITLILDDVRRGVPGARDRLLTLVYDNLRAIAAAQHARERAGNTLSPTALVNEAYLRVLAGEDVDLENRRHLFGAFARAMQQALVDAARKRGARKRGGDHARVPLESVEPPSAVRLADPVDLDRVLPRLQQTDPRAAEVLRFKCFLDLGEDDIATVLGVTTRTVQRDWLFAKAFVRTELEADESP